MCGICGIVRFDDAPVASEPIARACEALRHRGPDHTGAWLDDHRRVGLGATRLAVLDISPAAHQPQHRGDGRYHLVFNGEIYNYRELRAELIASGESFLTGGDTEVVLASCARWGTDALHRFNGMWALCFYDAQTRCGFLTRDRYGIKPLLYNATARSLVFASELRALMHLDDCDRTVDNRALVQHLQFGYIAHPRTIYNNVRRLPPGHFLTFRAASVDKPEPYHRPVEHVRASAPTSYADACAGVRHELRDAVARRRVSDVPIGAFLSGGLDSSICVAHLSEAMGRPVVTFCVGYEKDRAYDERNFAREVANHFQTEHHEIVLTESEVLDSIPRILDHLGEPVGDSSIVPTSLISQAARNLVTVAISGDGADELFGGYWRYLGHSAWDGYRRIPGVLRRAIIEPLLSGVSVARSSTLGNRARQLHKLLRTDAADPLARHVAWSRILAPQAESIFSDPELAPTADAETLERARSLTSALDPADPLARILAFDLQHQLPADMLQKVDLASMMHSLEVRVPFLDHRVVERALGMPSSYKIDRGLRKRILVDAYRGHLPDAVLDRPKQGFEVPIGEYLRGPLRELFRDTVTPDAVESFGILSYSGVERVYRDHVDRRADHADLLFALLSLCWWQKTHLSVG